jgi:magnesium protoporphyrin O-methyltransferase
MKHEYTRRVRLLYEGDAGRRWQRIEEERPETYFEQNIVIGRRRLHEQLLEWIAEAAHQRILDAGCGLGSLAAKMAEAGAVVTGADLVPAFVEAARQRTGPDGPTFAAGDFVQQFDGNTETGPFDAVVVTEVLEDYDTSERHELLKAIAASGVPRLYLAFRSTGLGPGSLWKHLGGDDDRELSEIELLRGIHLATPFRQKRQAKITVRNYRVHLSDLRREE